MRIRFDSNHQKGIWAIVFLGLVIISLIINALDFNLEIGFILLFWGIFGRLILKHLFKID